MAWWKSRKMIRSDAIVFSVFFIGGGIFFIVTYFITRSDHFKYMAMLGIGWIAVGIYRLRRLPSSKDTNSQM